MSKLLSFAALLMLAAGASPAAAADHCAFTSPASHACPADVAPRLRVATTQVAADHCIALTPASTSCPAAPAAAASLASAQSRPAVSLQASRN